MTDEGSEESAPEEVSAPLPDRDPRPLIVHVLINAIIAFGLVFVIGIILGARWQLLVLIAILAGVIAAPITRRVEIAQLAERRSRTNPNSTSNRASNPNPNSE